MVIYTCNEGRTGERSIELATVREDSRTILREVGCL